MSDQLDSAFTMVIVKAESNWSLASAVNKVSANLSEPFFTLLSPITRSYIKNQEASRSEKLLGMGNTKPRVGSREQKPRSRVRERKAEFALTG